MSRYDVEFSPGLEGVFGAGSKFRVKLEEPTWTAERTGKASRSYAHQEKPWLRRVECRVGGKGAHLYVHGLDLVGYSGAGMVLRSKLLAIPGVRSGQTGDNEFSVTFPPALIEQVAGIVRPRVRRILTPEQRAESAARLRATQFVGKNTQPVRLEGVKFTS